MQLNRRRGERAGCGGRDRRGGGTQIENFVSGRDKKIVHLNSSSLSKRNHDTRRRERAGRGGRDQRGGGTNITSFVSGRDMESVHLAGT